MKALRAQFEKLQKQTMAMSRDNGQDYATAVLAKQRQVFENSIAQMGNYDIATRKITSGTAEFTKKITEQKASFRDLIDNRHQFNKILKEQFQLQQSLSVQWVKNSATGKFDATLLMPEVSTFRSLRNEIGLLGASIASASTQMVNWGKNTQWAGRQLMVGFTVPAAIAGAAIAKMSFDFDKQLTRVVKVYGDASSGFVESSDSIRESAINTAKQVARAYGQTGDATIQIMADLAASGKTGQELQQATLATSRAAVLGELDWQDAVKATIAMQNVYKMSAQEVGDAFNYINAMENQTVLSAQDFVVAIPKVSGIMRELGGTLKDTGALMTAFKAAGIDAAEGANALKSINFRAVATYGKGLQTFLEATNVDLKDIVAETKGETIPTLMKMGEAMANLTPDKKVAVARDVFGIYQGSKAMMLIDQMMENTDQWVRAQEVGLNSIAENAAIANAELESMNERPYMRIQKVVAEMQITLQQAGETLLEWGANLADLAQKLLDIFGNLNGPTKAIALLTLGLTALAGPIIMLIGLTANLFAQGTRAIGKMMQMASGFKTLTVEMRLQQLLSGNVKDAFGKQAVISGELGAALRKLAGDYENLSAAQRKAAAAAFIKQNPQVLDKLRNNPPEGYLYNQNNRNFYKVDQATGRAVGQAVQQQEVLEKHVSLINAVGKSSDFAAENADKLAKGLGAVGLAASVLSMGIAETDGWINTAINSVFVLSMVMSTIPSVGERIVLLASAGFGKISKGFKYVGALIMKHADMLKMLGGAFGVLALVGVAAWNAVGDSVEANRKKTEAYLDTSKQIAEMLGQTYNAAPSIKPDNKMSQNQAAIEMAAKFTSTDEGKLARDEMFRRTGKDEGAIWGEAIAQGLAVKLHGGSEQAAKDATRIALAVMDKTFEHDADFEINLADRINFGDIRTVVREQANVFKKSMEFAMKDTGEGVERWWSENIQGNVHLTTGAATDAVKQVNDYWNLILTADKSNRKELIDGLAETINGDMRRQFDTLMEKNGDFMREKGIDTYEKFINNLSFDNVGTDAEYARRALTDIFGLNTEEQAAAQKKADLIKLLYGEISRLGGLDPNEMNNVGEALTRALAGAPEAQLSAAEAMRRYSAEMERMQAQGIILTDELRLVTLNTYRQKAGLERTGNAYDGFGEKTSVLADEQFKLADALTAAGVAAAVTEDAATSAYRGVMEGAQREIFDTAMQSLDAEMDAEIKGLQDKSDAELERLDNKAKEVDAKYDKLEKDQERKQKADEKAFEARQKRQTDILTATYDNRIKLIDNQIDALEQAIEVERKAEEQRQKIFEAEKTRIQRLSELYSSGIDINAAINTGDLDQAAKLTNDIASRQMTWANEDFMAVSGDASKQRIAGFEAKIDELKSQKDGIEEIKKARLDALKEVQDAEREAFRERQDMEREALRQQRDNAVEAVRVERETEQKRTEIAIEGAKDKWEARRTGLERELNSLREFLPMTQEQMNTQVTELERIYDKYGDNLTGKGETWAQVVAGALSRNVAAEGQKLATVVNWANVGAEIANSMIKGAFGMTPQQFTAWLNGGAAPGTSPFNPNNAGMSSKQIRQKYGNVLEFHSGGIVGGGGAVRTRPTLKSNEVPSVLLKKEGVLTESAVRAIGGPGVVHALNRGKGGADPRLLGMGSLPGAFAAATTGQMIGQVLMGLARNKMDQSGMGAPGTDLGSASSNAQWIFNRLRGLGFTAQAAAGIIGNLMQESGINPKSKQTNGPGRGIMQWTEGDRWARLVKWASANGKDPWNIATQFDWMIKEMKDYGVYTVMRGATDVSQATRLFESTMEKAGVPMMERRIAYAMEAYRTLANSTPTQGSPTDYLGSKIQLAGLPQAPAGTQYSSGKEFTLGRGFYTGGINPANYIRPIPGAITSGYGPRGLFGGLFHNGIDIAAPGGTPIKASSGGRILYSGFSKYGYGNYVLMQHPDGTITGYGHMSRRAATAGQNVARGQVIGYVGTTGMSTGDHLHFQTGRNGVWFNPRSALPQLRTGGFTMSDGLAMLHKNETVLTAPLSDKLKVGIDNLAQGDTNRYNVTIDMRGAVVRDESDIRKIKTAVREVLSETEKKNGPNRRIKR